jgi:hypothetical protein
MLIFHADSMRVFAGRHVGERGVIAMRCRAFDDAVEREGATANALANHAPRHRICRWR